MKYFGSAIHRRFEQIQAQLSDISAVAQESLSGVRVVRAYRQEAVELERFRRVERGISAAQPPADRAAGNVLPEHGAVARPRRAARLWLGSREVIGGRITLGAIRRVQRVPDDARLADDCVRLGHQHAAARDGVVEAHA